MSAEAPRAEQQPATGRRTADVRSYFATPVIIYGLPDAEALNAELGRSILERERSSETTQHSNLGGWQSTWDIDAWGGEAVKTVLGTARKLADLLTGDRAGNPVKIDWRMNAWANVNRSGHGNEFHTHPGCFWSGTYYVDDGGAADNEDLGGEFELQDPRGVAPAMYAPNLCFRIAGGQSAGASELIRPKAGNMMLFPSWLSHAVRPYHGDGIRISIAFNLSV